MKLTIQRKLILTLLIPIIATLFISGWLTFLLTQPVLETNGIKLYNAEIDKTVADIEEYYSQIETTVNMTAQIFEGLLGNNDMEYTGGPILENIMRGRPDILCMYVCFTPYTVYNNNDSEYYKYYDWTYGFDENGTVSREFVIYDEGHEDFYNYSGVDGEGWYDVALDTGKFTWAPPYFDTYNSVPMVTALNVIKFPNGTIAGMVGMDVPLTYMDDYIRKLKLPGDSYPFLIETSQGTIITHEKASYCYENAWNSTEDGLGFTTDMWLEDTDNNAQLKTILASMQNGEDGNSEYGENIVFYRYIPSMRYAIGFVIPESTIYEVAITTINYQMLFAAFNIGMALIIILIIAKSFSKPITKMDSFVKKIQNNDFTAKLSIKDNTELGDLGQGLTQMQSALIEQVVASNNNSIALSSMAEELSSMSEEISSSSESIASSQQQISKGSTHQFEMVTATQIKLKDLLDSTQKVREYVEKVNNISDAITNIADQTEMLALNAAIESARAGEAGRGFSVVADQVRKLADQSKRSVDDTNEVLQEIFMIAEHQEMKTAELVDSMNNIVAIVEETSANTEESAAAAEEQAASMESISASAQHLLSLAENLRKTFADIKIDEQLIENAKKEQYQMPFDRKKGKNQPASK